MRCPFKLGNDEATSDQGQLVKEPHARLTAQNQTDCSYTNHASEIVIRK